MLQMFATQLEREAEESFGESRDHQLFKWRAHVALKQLSQSSLMEGYLSLGRTMAAAGAVYSNEINGSASG